MKKRAARGQPGAADTLIDALGEAGWAEADRALAHAVIEIAQLERELPKIGKSAAALKRAQTSFALLAQALDTVARRRGVSRIGAAGERARYDRNVHELEGAGRAPARVKLLAPGAAKGGEVLVKARVKPAPARRASTTSKPKRSR